MKVIGIMTCFNRKSKTINSINTLIKNNPQIEFEFVIVDDSSKDGTRDELVAKFSNVTVINGNGNLFYSGGMRVGIDYVKKEKKDCDFILLFNDDVDFYKNCIQNMISYKKKADSIVVGATENDSGKLSYGGVKKISTVRPSFCILMSTPEKREYCDTFNANCVLIDKNVFMLLNNIDKVYRHSLGDYDYGLDATRNGYKICVTDFFVGHCNNNPVSDNWLDKEKSRTERLKKKESIKGLPTKIWFHFVNKNFNFVSAIIYSVIPYIRIMVKK